MFNSRNINYRSPLGAVAAGERVHFKITPQRSLECKGAYMIIEGEGSSPLVYDMFWCGMNGNDREWWECHFSPPGRGIYFYHFEIKTSRGHSSLFRGINGEAVTASYGSRWQLTAYEPAFSTPTWLTGGVIYQIFPDRFYFSGKEKNLVPKDRSLRDDWGQLPEWKPDENGKITNSDYFKGDLSGIEEKLPYLKSLGVTCIYLNPIFEAHSNHRYNTADYSRIDPLLGTEKDFISLCGSAEKQGIKIILDGVFNHTGSDSIYFNRENRYEEQGAYNSKESPYFPWYNFSHWPDKYESWWNFDTLPNVSEENPEYCSYITAKGGIIPHWLKQGAAGWRLDVADELPDSFLDKIYESAKNENPDALIMGEVWEDASNKTAYGIRRRYLLGGQMDTVMNYPFREAILSFLTGGHSSLCMEQIEDIVENYPPRCLHLLMNHIGTHDTERAITVLAGKKPGGDRKWQSETKLTAEEYETGVKKLKLASLLQFTLPGVPCIYYGDEAGLQGYRDPFNRGCFPWGREDRELTLWYTRLGRLRSENEIFKNAGLQNLYSHNSIMCFKRFGVDKDGNESSVVVAVNRSDSNVVVPVTLTDSVRIMGAAYNTEFKLPPYGYSVHLIGKSTAD